MAAVNVATILDRTPAPYTPNADELRARRWLVTGANGSIGTRVVEVLRHAGAYVFPTDIDYDTGRLDVTDRKQVEYAIEIGNPDIVLHLAGAKHAPLGELDPMLPSRVHIDGTNNVLEAAGRRRVVTASTCKACNPETAYGASKLIAERLTLNAGQSVARFHNVVETQGNVFDIWQETPRTDPIDVAPFCSRFFVSLDEAVGVVLYAALADSPGRFVANPHKVHNMKHIADRAYPNRRKRYTHERRGDRLAEPFIASGESAAAEPGVPGILRVVGKHDA